MHVASSSHPVSLRADRSRFEPGRIPPLLLLLPVSLSGVDGSATGRYCGRRFSRVTRHSSQRQDCPLNELIPRKSERKVKNTVKSSKTIRANKRKAKLRAKHRRQRARANA
jgi:hypothetical protein